MQAFTGFMKEPFTVNRIGTLLNAEALSDNCAIDGVLHYG